MGSRLAMTGGVDGRPFLVCPLPFNRSTEASLCCAPSRVGFIPTHARSDPACFWCRPARSSRKSGDRVRSDLGRAVRVRAALPHEAAFPSRAICTRLPVVDGLPFASSPRTTRSTRMSRWPGAFHSSNKGARTFDSKTFNLLNRTQFGPLSSANIVQNRNFGPWRTQANTQHP